MSSRAELKQMCEELSVVSDGLSIEEMREVIREEADKKFNKKYHISADDLSVVLKRFLVEEYDYVILDKEGKEIEI